jgi:SPP1 family predicted phage head-tail adaptor
MRAGRLRHRLVLQSKTTTQNEYGEPVVSYVTQATVYGGIEPLSGNEIFKQQQIQAEASVRIVLRYYSGLDETWRITHNGKYYDILNVINQDERDYMLVLMCSEGVREN